MGEGAYGVGVVGVDGRHADAGVLEVPGLGEGRDVAQGAADEVGGVLGGAATRRHLPSVRIWVTVMSAGISSMS